MTTYSMEPAMLWHVAELAEHMRTPDRQEVWAAAHQEPEQAAYSSLLGSRDARVGLADGKVLCMFGVGSLTILSLTGIPWLLATKKLERHSRAFLRRNRGVLADMGNGYTLLRNHVDARNKAAIRWLGWLGFTILPTETYGMDQLSFHPFEMRLENHV